MSSTLFLRLTRGEARQDLSHRQLPLFVAGGGGGRGGAGGEECYSDQSKRSLQPQPKPQRAMPIYVVPNYLRYPNLVQRRYKGETKMMYPKPRGSGMSELSHTS